MRILTIGLSPYLLTSRSRLNAEILKHYNLMGIPVASLVWGHDRTYHVPEEVKGQSRFFYKFKYKNIDRRIPLTLFEKDKDQTVCIYETIKKLKPDIVITIGDYTEFSCMKAVKMYTEDFKWIFMLCNGTQPINEYAYPTFEDPDAIVCSNPKSLPEIREIYPKDAIVSQIIGVDRGIYYDRKIDRKPGLRVMSCGKKTSSDNVPMLMETFADMAKDIDGWKTLYLHSNINDSRDHNLDLLKSRFDPDDKLISFPDRFVSITDGYSDEEFAEELSLSDIFVSIPITSSTSMSVLEAMACGCYPLMSSCGSNLYLAEELSDYLGNNFRTEDFIVQTIKVMVPGEHYVNVPMPDDLKEKMLNAQRNLRNNKGLREKFEEFTKKYNRDTFFETIDETIEKVLVSNPVVCLETV